jgi:trans-aconitate methyltransferase
VKADERVPSGIDTSKASEARVYDYLLGGVHNLEVDRRVGEQILAEVPDARLICYANREFLRRVVEFLVDVGVRQFLDIGAGIPTVGHTHEVAQARAPESRVVFVDIDPLAVTHCRLILGWNDRTAVIQEDVRRPERVLKAVEAGGLLDLNQPVAVLMVVLLQFIADADDPWGVVSRLMRPLVAGSYLALSDPTNDGPKDFTAVQKIARRGGFDVAIRSHRQMLAMFEGLELVEPGLVWIPQWRPTTTTDAYHDRPEASGYYAGVGRKT